MAFSTRRGGVSQPPYDALNLGRSTSDRREAVEQNRRRLLTALGLDSTQLATAGQVHGAAVIRAREAGLHPACDALVTTEPGLTLAVSAADCLPVLLSSTRGVAAVHAGWRGAAAGAPTAAMRALMACSEAAPSEVRAHLGPCIRDCCYRVGIEVARRFPHCAVWRDNDTMYLSLPAAVRHALLEEGVPPDAIEDTGACTSCEPHWYFSHRRDHGETGRQWGLIARVDSET
jgi:hypothetical protein